MWLSAGWTWLGVKCSLADSVARMLWSLFDISSVVRCSCFLLQSYCTRRTSCRRPGKFPLSLSAGNVASSCLISGQHLWVYPWSLGLKLSPTVQAYQKTKRKQTRKADICKKTANKYCLYFSFSIKLYKYWHCLDLKIQNHISASIHPAYFGQGCS